MVSLYCNLHGQESRDFSTPRSTILAIDKSPASYITHHKLLAVDQRLKSCDTLPESRNIGRVGGVPLQQVHLHSHLPITRHSDSDTLDPRDINVQLPPKSQPYHLLYLHLVSRQRSSTSCQNEHNSFPLGVFRWNDNVKLY